MNKNPVACYNNASSNLALDIKLEQNAGSFHLWGI